MPPLFELRSKRFPILAISFPQRFFLGMKRCFAVLLIAGYRPTDRMSPSGNAARRARIPAAKFDQKRWRSGFAQPEEDLYARGARGTIMKIYLDQTAHHRPVFVALSFFRLD